MAEDRVGTEEGRPDWGPWAVLAVVVALGLAVRLAWLAAVPTQPVTDFAWYFDRAVSIANGQGYSVDGRPTAYWPFGYPAFLGAAFALMGPSLGLAKALNTALTLLAVVLAWVVARRLYPSVWVAHGTALILALHPAFVAYSGVLASEPLFTCLTLVGSALCLFCPRRSLGPVALGGAVLGLATLVRPQAVLLPGLILVCLAVWDGREAFRGRLLLTLCVAYCGLALALLPWTVRNLNVFDRFVFVSTNGGDNLLIGHHPGATGRWKDPVQIEPRLAGLGEVQRDRTARSLALFYLRQDPLQPLRTGPERLEATFWSGSDAAYWAFQTEPGRLVTPGRDGRRGLFLSFRRFAEGAAVGVGSLFAIGLAVAGLKRARVPLLPIALVAMTAALSLLFFGNPRFGFPALPFLVMAGLGGLAARRGPVDG